MAEQAGDRLGWSGRVDRALPQDIRYCVSPDGVGVAYAEAGHGPPLVKAANWLTHLELEWDSPIWAHWLHGFAERHRLIRYDERGCGLSDWDVDDFSFDAWVDDLELVVDAVGVERFPLLGVSQGGAVAIAYAVRHPERVSHLILAGAYGRGRLVRAVNAAERDEAALDLDIARVGWRRDDDAFRLVFASQFLPDGTRELWDAFIDLQRATTSTDNLVQVPRGVRPDRRVAPGAQGALPDADRALPRRPAGTAVPGPRARRPDPGQPSGPAEQPEPHPHRDEPAWPVFLDEIERFLGSGGAR